MASIRKRDGKYQARVSRLGWGSVAKTFTTRLDAERWARKQEILAERGCTREEGSSDTLQSLLERYCKTVTPTKKNARAEALILKQWQKHPLACKLPHQVQPAEIAIWRDTMLAAGKSPSTIRNHLAALSAVYRHAATEWGMEVLGNPVLKIRRPLPTRPRTRRVEPGEIEAIKENSQSVLLPDIIDLAVETGMRLSEILSLHHGAIDLAKRIVSLGETKNGDGRVVPLSNRATEILSRHVRSGCRQQISLFSITSHAVTVSFRRAVQRARRRLEHFSSNTALQDLRFHDLRREAISRMFERGLSVMEVSAISGHKVLQMLKTYTQLHMVDIASKLD